MILQFYIAASCGVVTALSMGFGLFKPFKKEKQNMFCQASCMALAVILVTILYIIS